LSQSIRYASVIAKIGAERSKLLSETKLKALSESKSVSEISAHLRDTSYQEYLSELSSPITGRKLERIFHENLIDTYLKIIEYSPEQAVRYLELYLLRIQSENLKSLIRAAHARLPTEQRTSRIYLSVEKYFKQAELVEEATKASAIAQIVHVYKRTD